MELQISGKQMKVAPEVRSYIENKLRKLNRHLPRMKECRIEVSEERTKSADQRFVAQVTIDSAGTLLRGEERADDLFAAIDKVVAVMDRQIERYKGKLQNKGRGNSLARGDFDDEAEADALEKKITRVKRFKVKALSVYEAIDQMELLGHDFFLFLNYDSNELNLIYRRKDGNYGMIEAHIE